MQRRTVVVVSKWVHQKAEIPLRDGALRLAVIADTHGAPHAATARHLGALGPDAILHAGDVGDDAFLADFARIAPVIAIRGNIDPKGLPDAITIALGDALRVLLLHIGVTGPRLRADAARLARAEGAHLVVCGHSHVPFMGRNGEILIFNPGSVGPRRFHLPIVFGVLELGPRGLSMRHVDCETGLPWEPPSLGQPSTG